MEGRGNGFNTNGLRVLKNPYSPGEAHGIYFDIPFIPKRTYHRSGSNSTQAGFSEDEDVRVLRSRQFSKSTSEVGATNSPNILTNNIHQGKM